MKTKFNKTPKCEVCENEDAISFSSMEIIDGMLTHWKVCGLCTSDTEKYYVEIYHFFDSPSSTVDWLAHLNEKSMDWKNFMEMMERFRRLTNSFGA